MNIFNFFGAVLLGLASVIALGVGGGLLVVKLFEWVEKKGMKPQNILVFSWLFVVAIALILCFV